MGYFTCWSSMPPDQINYTNYDWIDFAFATVDANQQIFFPDSSCAVRLKQVVQNAHAQGKHAKLSIGGWEGSQYFSSGVSSPTSRQTLVNSVAAVIENFTLDGIDFDWEYPGRQGLGGNQVDPADSDNFFLFLQLLRSSISRGIKITAAVSQTPFVGRDGHPMKDVAQFAKVLDWITLMNYDVWQSSPSPGPNAPLSDGCHNSSQPEASAASAIKQWSAAGFPEAQQVLGVPFYGYLSDSTVTRLRSRDSNVPSRALADDGNRTGSVMFGNLVKQGILALVWSSSGKPTFSGAGEFRRYWDACSSTPYLRSQVTNQVIAYDDPESLDMKVQLVKGTGLKGINSWSLDGDYQGILGSNMRRAL
ncbi:glycoside hydrolase family 18 protein [Collybiopsis luxurians FD-317 M1]|nr:glycoside hydrolase family 18 protein [Collybiopsis luxurians FD-317 M1]